MASTPESETASVVWQAEGLRRLTQAMTQLLTTEITPERLAGLLGHLGAHLNCDIHTTFQAHDGGLRLVAASGLSNEVRGSIQNIQIGEQLCGQCAERKQPLFVNADSMQDACSTFWDLGIRSYAGFPVFAGGDLVGTLAFASRTVDELSEDQIEFIRSIVSVVGAFFAKVETESTVRELQAEHKVILDRVKSVIWQYDLQATVYDYVSGFCCELLGFPAEDWYANGFWESRVHPDDLGSVLRKTREAVEAGSDHEIEYRMNRKDDRVIWVKDVVNVVQVDGKTISLCGTMMDVTADKQANARQRQDHKMDAIDRLAGGIAHDFNNALSVVQTYCEILLQRLEPNDENRICVKAICEASGRATALTKKMMTFSRQLPTLWQPLNLNDVLSANRSLIERAVGDEMELELDLDSEIGLVRADRNQIEQLILNLVANSLGAMSQGGRLTLQTRRLTSDGVGNVVSQQDSANHCVELTVRDTGCGMDDMTKARCLEPFFSTRPNGRGAGMGLAVAYGVINSSGGRIDIESEPGRGTSVRVYLPVAT